MNHTSNPTGNPAVSGMIGGKVVLNLRDASEFDRFTDLAHKIVQVPKGEIDDQRQAAQSEPVNSA
jgi:hypothetical protein